MEYNNNYNTLAIFDRNVMDNTFQAEIQSLTDPYMYDELYNKLFNEILDISQTLKIELTDGKI